MLLGCEHHAAGSAYDYARWGGSKKSTMYKSNSFICSRASRQSGSRRNLRIVVSVDLDTSHLTDNVYLTSCFLAWNDMSVEMVARMEDVRAQRLERGVMATMPQRWDALNSVGDQLLERQFSRRPELLAYGINLADLAL